MWIVTLVVFKQNRFHGTVCNLLMNIMELQRWLKWLRQWPLDLFPLPNIFAMEMSFIDMNLSYELLFVPILMQILSGACL